MQPTKDESTRATVNIAQNSKLDGVFRKSTHSNSGGCVAVAKYADGSVKVRDTKDPFSPTLSFTAHEWAMFLKGARDGEFDIEQPEK
jgi:hypothetical protein